MTRKLFKQCCEALWGPQYRSEGARQLGISLRTMMRYDNGDTAVAPVIDERIRKLLRQRTKHIEQLHAQLEVK